MESLTDEEIRIAVREAAAEGLTKVYTMEMLMNKTASEVEQIAADWNIHLTRQTRAHIRQRIYEHAKNQPWFQWHILQQNAAAEHEDGKTEQTDAMINGGAEISDGAAIDDLKDNIPEHDDVNNNEPEEESTSNAVTVADCNPIVPQQQQSEFDEYDGVEYTFSSDDNEVEIIDNERRVTFAETVQVIPANGQPPANVPLTDSSEVSTSRSETISDPRFRTAVNNGEAEEQGSIQNEQKNQSANPSPVNISMQVSSGNMREQTNAILIENNDSNVNVRPLPISSFLENDTNEDEDAKAALLSNDEKQADDDEELGGVNTPSSSVGFDEQFNNDGDSNHNRRAGSNNIGNSSSDGNDGNNDGGNGNNPNFRSGGDDDDEGRNGGVNVGNVEVSGNQNCVINCQCLLQ